MSALRRIKQAKFIYMNVLKFQSLIQAITKRPFLIKTSDENIQTEKEYYIYYTLPLTGIDAKFYWKTSKKKKKLLRSFITAFTSKYREPNPRAYDYMVRTYGESAKWENYTDKQKEYAFNNHSGFMYSKTELLKQIENNFNTPEIESAMLKYGFYPTEYGIGIFAFWQSEYVKNAIKKLHLHLTDGQIPFKNEWSDAGWVFRFKLGLTKDIHHSIIESINQ